MNSRLSVKFKKGGEGQRSKYPNNSIKNPKGTETKLTFHINLL